MPRNYFVPSKVNNHERPRPQGVKHGGMNHVVNFPLIGNDSPAPLPPAARRRAPGGK